MTRAGKMARREAIRKALAFEAVSPVPYNFDFTTPVRQRLAKHFGCQDVDEAVGNYILQINVGSNAGAEVNRVAAGLMEPQGNDVFKDEFGVIWNKGAGDDIGIPTNCAIAEPDAALINLPDCRDPRRWKGFDEIRSKAGDRYVLACFSSPLFQRAWFLRGMENFLVDLAINEPFAHALLDSLADFSVAIVDEAARRGADGIFFYDDYAQQRGLFFSPAMFREFFSPRMARIFSQARGRGLDVFFHSCGDVTLVLEDILAAGAQVFNPLQPEVMNVDAIARTFAGRLAFYGGLSTQKTLPFGTPADVRAEVRRLKDLFRSSGGFILSAAHAVQRDVPQENVLALIEEAAV
ncbi:MAG: uroporphyrinogen-III decarboxylase-like protein [Planctomycetes bacterium]|nr:uroporphyrinogen-III decarboxylase-like protein [Planctomycetota bacterium]